MNNINDLQEQFENLIKQGQELLEKMKENHIADASKKVRWKPKDGEHYYVVMPNGDIRTYIWNNDVVDYGSYDLGNCFKTEEEAQKERDRRIAEQELLDMCDWEDEKYCCEIYYDFAKERFIADCSMSSSCFSPYRFASGESVKKAIDTLGTEKLKLIFRID